MPKKATEPHANRQSRFGRQVPRSNFQANLLHKFPSQVDHVRNLRTADDLRMLRVEIFRFAVNRGTVSCAAQGLGANSGNP